MLPAPLLLELGGKGETAGRMVRIGQIRVEHSVGPHAQDRVPDELMVRTASAEPPQQPERARRQRRRRVDGRGSAQVLPQRPDDRVEAGRPHPAGPRILGIREVEVNDLRPRTLDRPDVLLAPLLDVLARVADAAPGVPGADSPRRRDAGQHRKHRHIRPDRAVARKHRIVEVR